MARKPGKKVDLPISKPVGSMPVVPRSDGPFVSASKTMRDALLSASMSATSPANVSSTTPNPNVSASSPVISPVSSQVENSSMIEILQMEVNENGAKFDQLMVIFEQLLKGQADGAAQVRSSVSKIEGFEKLLVDFLAAEAEDDSASGDPLEDTNSVSSRNKKPFIPFHDRFSSLTPLVEKDTNFSITRSIQPANPLLSQVKLNSLTAKSVFVWGELMEIEQQNIGFELLQWGRYIDPTICQYIQAINNHKKYHKPVMLRNKYISMNNDQLYDLLVKIVGPTSHEEYMEIFNSLTKFTHLPNGYIFDITRYEFMYMAILQYLYLLQRVITFLDWNGGRQYAPAMKTKDGRIGYMELIWRKIPSNLGQRLHLGLSAQQVSECRDIRDYLLLFGHQSQLLQDDSVTAKKNRLRFEGNLALTADSEVNNKSHAATGKFPVNPKLTYLNSMLSQPFSLSDNPYIPVEKSELPENSHDFLRPVNNNRYNISTDEDLDDFDYYDANFDTVPVKSVINPLYTAYDASDNVPQSQVFDSDQVGMDHTNLHVLDAHRMRTLPCFNAIKGRCPKGNSCEFSHDKVILQKEYDQRIKDLAFSPFARKDNPSTSVGVRPNVMSDQRRHNNFPSSPFASKQLPKHLNEMYAVGPIPPPEIPTQVTILGKNVV
jgi:hypothetical protein